jgi:enoyl-CoA hydratase
VGRPLMATTLRVTRGPVWEIVLNRPASANALSADLVEELIATLDEVTGSADREAPVAVVLRGTPRHFAAGFDLAGLHDESDASLALRFLRIGVLLERLHSLPVLTVAAVEGAAYGAGGDLVAACDVRLATTSARFRFPGSRFGVVLGTARLAALVGAAKTVAWVSGAGIDAERAAHAGLVTELVADAEALDAAVGRHVTAWAETEPAARAALLAQARPAATSDALAALARSVAVPGLRERIASYAGLTLSPSIKENA